MTITITITVSVLLWPRSSRPPRRRVGPERRRAQVFYSIIDSIAWSYYTICTISYVAMRTIAIDSIASPRPGLLYSVVILYHVVL